MTRRHSVGRLVSASSVFVIPGLGRLEELASHDGILESRRGGDAAVVANREKLELREAVLQRIDPDGLEVEEVSANRE